MEKDGNDLKSPLLQHPNDLAITIVSPNKNMDKRLRTVVFRVGGVTCSSCVASIETALERLDGVENVAVSVLQGQAVVKYLPDTISVSQFKIPYPLS